MSDCEHLILAKNARNLASPLRPSNKTTPNAVNLAETMQQNYRRAS
jgi:hypothetical protein